MTTAIPEHAEKHWTADCDHAWIEKEGKPNLASLLKFQVEFKTGLSLTKWLIGFIFGGQLLTVALIVYYK